MENLNNGWIHRESRLPAETDGDSTGKVFAWHAYQGVMLARWDDFPKNSFNIYWMRLSEGINAPWIVATERKPTKEDSDALDCVLAKSGHGDISITGFHQFDWNSDLSTGYPRRFRRMITRNCEKCNKKCPQLLAIATDGGNRSTCINLRCYYTTKHKYLQGFSP